MSNLIEFLNQSEVVQAFSMSLMHSLWQGAGIAVLLWLVLKITPSIQASMRYWLALLAGCLLLGCIAFTFGLYLTIPSVGGAPDESIASISLLSAANTITTEGTSRLLQTQWIRLQHLLQEHSSYFLMVWLVGFLFYTFRLSTGLFYIRQIESQSSSLPAHWVNKLQLLQQKMGVLSNVRLISSDRVGTPLTFGWIKPVIVFPASMLTLLPPDQVESILLHELAHIRRHDFLVNLLQQFAGLFLFFNPGYWYITQVLETEREFVCDDLAIQQTGKRHTYTLALANLAQLPFLEQRSLVMAAATKENSLLIRIKRTAPLSGYTAPDSNHLGIQTGALVLACILALFLTTGFQEKAGKAATPIRIIDSTTEQEQQVPIPAGKSIDSNNTQINSIQVVDISDSGTGLHIDSTPWPGKKKTQVLTEGTALIKPAVPAVKWEAPVITDDLPDHEPASKQDKIIIRTVNKSQPDDTSIQPTYLVFEHDVFKGLTPGSPAYTSALASGKRTHQINDIGPETIMAIHVLKGQAAVDALGDSGLNGAILIVLKGEEPVAKPGDDAV